MAAPATAEAIRDVNTRYHDAAAEHYDTKWGVDFGEIGRRQVRGKLRKLLGTPLPPFGRSLEIGAGTGYFTLNMLQDGVVREAVATDISPGMLDALQANAPRIGVEVETVACDAEALPVRGRLVRPRARPRGPAPHPPPRPRVRRVPPRAAARRRVRSSPASRRSPGDRIAAYPKRAALRDGAAVAHADARAPGRRLRRRPTRTASGRRARRPRRRVARGVRRRARLHARRARAPGRARRASTTSACAARSCWPTGSAG